MRVIIEIKLAMDQVTSKVGCLWESLLGKINWLYVRMTVVAAGVIPGFFLPLGETPEDMALTWESFVMIFLGPILGLQFVIGIQAFNPASAKTWERPNWKSNPFNLKQPLQFVHFMGWFMIFSSVPYLILLVQGHRGSLFPSVMTALFGLGILVGTRLSILLFRKKFTNG